MKLHEAVAVTYAAMGQELSDAALKVICIDLQPYPQEGVLRSLSRCRKELKRLCLADIIDRIPGGHPGAEEAWAMVAHMLGNESATIVWTPQISEAFFVADNLSDDPIAARMAFKECYTKAVAIARENADPVTWTASLGHDASGREAVLLEAVEKGRLSAPHVNKLLPHKPAPLADGLEVRLLA